MSNTREIIESDKFKSTNKIWNDKKFNAISNVGPMMQIVKGCHNLGEFTSEYYKCYRGLERLESTAEAFRRACLAEGIELTSEEAYKYAWIRVVYQTWEGYSRELRVMEQLREYTDLIIEPATYEEDVKYAIDAKAYRAGKLMFGIQIKPKSYKNCYTSSHMINFKKNQLFKNDYKRDVIYIYA